MKLQEILYPVLVVARTVKRSLDKSEVRSNFISYKKMVHLIIDAKLTYSKLASVPALDQVAVYHCSVN